MIKNIKIFRVYVYFHLIIECVVKNKKGKNTFLFILFFFSKMENKIVANYFHKQLIDQINVYKDIIYYNGNIIPTYERSYLHHTHKLNKTLWP